MGNGNDPEKIITDELLSGTDLSSFGKSRFAKIVSFFRSPIGSAIGSAVVTLAITLVTIASRNTHQLFDCVSDYRLRINAITNALDSLSDNTLSSIAVADQRTVVLGAIDGGGSYRSHSPELNQLSFNGLLTKLERCDLNPEGIQARREFAGQVRTLLFDGTTNSLPKTKVSVLLSNSVRIEMTYPLPIERHVFPLF